MFSNLWHLEINRSQKVVDKHRQKWGCRSWGSGCTHCLCPDVLVRGGSPAWQLCRTAGFYWSHGQQTCPRSFTQDWLQASLPHPVLRQLIFVNLKCTASHSSLLMLCPARISHWPRPAIIMWILNGSTQHTEVENFGLRLALKPTHQQCGLNPVQSPGEKRGLKHLGYHPPSPRCHRPAICVCIHPVASTRDEFRAKKRPPFLLGVNRTIHQVRFAQWAMKPLIQDPAYFGTHLVYCSVFSSLLAPSCKTT